MHGGHAAAFGTSMVTAGAAAAFTRLFIGRAVTGGNQDILLYEARGAKAGVRRT